MSHTESEEMTMGRAVQCPECRKLSYLCPKAVGHQPYLWEINCTRCHKFYLELNAYTHGHRSVVASLEQLRESYLEGVDSQELDSRMGPFAETYDPVLPTQKCRCGGELSIAAKPRCLHCDALISDSYFHFVDEAPG